MLTRKKKDFETLLTAFKNQRVVKLTNKQGVVFEKVIPITMTRDKLVCVDQKSRNMLMFEEASEVEIVGNATDKGFRTYTAEDFEQAYSIVLGTKRGEVFVCDLNAFSLVEMQVTSIHNLLFEKEEVVQLRLGERKYKVKIWDAQEKTIKLLYDYFSGVRIAKHFGVEAQETIDANLDASDVADAVKKMKTAVHQGNKLFGEYLVNLPILISKMDAIMAFINTSVLDMMQDEIQKVTEFFFTLVEGQEKDTLQHFLGLYKEDPADEMASMQADINLDVDDLIAQVQGQLDSGKEQIVIEEDEERTKKRLSLAGYQKHLEGKQRSAQNLEASVEKFVTHLEFHEEIQQMFKNVHSSFVQLGQLLIDNIEIVRMSDPYNFGRFLMVMSDTFRSQGEKNIFVHFINVLQGVTDPKLFKKQVPSNLTVAFDHFTQHYFLFIKNILNSTSVFTKRAVTILSGRITFLLAESERLEQFSSDSIESMNKISEVMGKTLGQGAVQEQMVSQMMQDLKDFSTSTDEYKDQLAPIIEFLDSHKLVQKRVKSWLRVLAEFGKALFCETEHEITSVFDPKHNSFSPFVVTLGKFLPGEKDQKKVKEIFKDAAGSME